MKIKFICFIVFVTTILAGSTENHPKSDFMRNDDLNENTIHEIKEEFVGKKRLPRKFNPLGSMVTFEKAEKCTHCAIYDS